MEIEKIIEESLSAFHKQGEVGYYMTNGKPNKKSTPSVKKTSEVKKQ